ncbi:MAG: ABC transporter ATP-binding protein [Acidimicrobiales bacterium]
MSEAVLALENVSAGYGQADVVREIDLDVHSGEVVALFGPNGAGKTTTLRVISGLIEPSRGMIRFKGRDLAHLSPTQRARSGIAHVPEGRGIFFGLTVSEHVRLGYRGETIDPELVYTYFPALRRLHDRPAGLLSGGEQQMLAVARNLARRPDLLLLDELSLGLAPVLVEGLLPVVRDYAKNEGCAVLLIEQHVPLALQIADRCYVLSHGDVVLHEPVERVRQNQDLIISSYLGRSVATEEAPPPSLPPVDSTPG